MIKILGIDPALRKTGWAIIEKNNNILNFIASGTIKTNDKESMSDRLSDLHYQLAEIIEDHQPKQAAIEETFVNNNSLSSLKLGQARGAIIVTCAIFDLKIYEYASTSVKKAITGVGRADKNQIAQMVKYIMPKAKFNSDDESDAIAIAICHNNSTRF
ncbi:crossover junction endodeoxyribonuclease RuvC [Rickettsiales bacterium]|nr:crossover junction endodeoxyribonuclease RuvC [Rickettsiales bacterium]